MIILLIYWCLVSFLFYIMMLGVRVGTIMLSTDFNWDGIVIDPHELPFHNFYLASLSSAMAFNFVLAFALTLLRRNGKLTKVVRRTINHIAFLGLGGFVAVTEFMFLISMNPIPFNRSLDIYKDFGFVYVSIPVILLLSSWPSLHWIIGKIKWRMLAVGFIIYGSISFAMSNYDLSIHQEFNSRLLTNRGYQLVLPDPGSHPRSRDYEIYGSLYITFDEDSVLALFKSNYGERMSIAELKSHIKTLAEVHDEYFSCWDLYIDNSVPFDILLGVEAELRKTEAYCVNYKTSKGGREVQQKLLRFNHYVDGILDSLSTLGMTNYPAEVKTWYAHWELPEMTRALLTIDKDGYILNNSRISESDLSGIITKLHWEYAYNFILLVQIEDDVEYEEYLKFLVMIRKIELMNKDRYSRKMFDREYQGAYYSIGTDIEVDLQMPLYARVWTWEERELMRYIEKREAAAEAAADEPLVSEN